MTQTPSVSWRWLTSQDHTLLSSLYDLAFGVSSESHFTDDFPVWDPRLEVRGRIQMGGFIGTRLVATASSRPCRSVDGLGLLIVGGVVVHPEFRGQGLASQGVSELLTQDARGTFVLWGSEKSLYARFGFKDAGIQKRAPLSSFRFTPGKHEVKSGWSSVIERGIRERNSGLAIDENEMTLVRSSKNIQWLSLDVDHRYAFVGIGKGIDLPGIIHTWGGDADLLSEILDRVTVHVSENFEIIWHPDHEKAYPFLGTSTSFARETLLMLRSQDAEIKADHLWFWGTDSA